MTRTREERERARRRALRAAQVATLGLVVATPGCYQSNQRAPEGAAPDVVVASDGGTDAAIDGEICDSTWEWERFSECCDANGWDFERGCTAWGPFVPPADGQVA